MSQDEVTSEMVCDRCDQKDEIKEFVDTVNGTEIAAKLREQIERLQGIS